MQRINTWQDAYKTGEAELGLGDGLSVRLALGRVCTIDESAGRVVKVWDYLNQREQMIYGDTGDRDISALLTNATGKAYISRVGNLVTLDLDGILPTADLESGVTFLTPPAGFRPSLRRDFPLPASATANLWRSAFFFAGGGLGVWLPSVGDSYRTTLTYRTTEPWPASLPGVPA